MPHPYVENALKPTPLPVNLNFVPPKEFCAAPPCFRHRNQETIRERNYGTPNPDLIIYTSVFEGVNSI